MKIMRIIFSIPIALLVFFIVSIVFQYTLSMINGIQFGSLSILSNDGNNSIYENGMLYILMALAGYIYYMVGIKVANNNGDLIKYLLILIMFLLSSFIIILHFKENEIKFNLEFIGYLILNICPLIGCLFEYFTDRKKGNEEI